MREQLHALQEQVARMAGQLERTAATLDRLADGLPPLVEVADGARRELGAATAGLVATSRELQRIAQLAEPLDAMGKRVVEQLRRVTGRRE